MVINGMYFMFGRVGLTVVDRGVYQGVLVLVSWERLILLILACVEGVTMKRNTSGLSKVGIGKDFKPKEKVEGIYLRRTVVARHEYLWGCGEVARHFGLDRDTVRLWDKRIGFEWLMFGPYLRAIPKAHLFLLVMRITTGIKRINLSSVVKLWHGVGVETVSAQDFTKVAGRWVLKPE